MKEKTVEVDGNLTKYVVQKKNFWWWSMANESEEGYYFSLKDAEHSIQQIEDWENDKQMLRERKDGSVYFTTSDFLKRRGVKEQLEKLKNSGIIQEIERNNKRKNGGINY